MKILTTLFSGVMFLIALLSVSILATFFLTIFMPENVVNAIEIFKTIIS